MRHLIHSRDISRSDIEELFRSADELRLSREESLKGRILACLFFEPSTRTRFSFESAMHRLGGSVIGAENAREFSSASKGETIEDMMRVVSLYADGIVIRHHEEGTAARAAHASQVPVINAGDGIGQHPTQALLDLYTIWRERGSIDSLQITIVGDLKNGRTVKSLLWALSQFSNISVTLVSPSGLYLPEQVRTELRKTSLVIEETEALDPHFQTADVVYQTRIQKERFADQNEYERYKSCYCIDKAGAMKMKATSLLLHPLPRVDEISADVDDLAHAAYFRQAENGLFMRMAILKHLLG